MTDFPVTKIAHEDVLCGFDRWAEVYDEQPNPLILLEERVVSQLLPSLRDRDVIDVGCGTGRWLDRIALSEPRSLIGVDASVTMLDRARAKLGGKAILCHGDCTELPVASASADLLLCSFVLSYVAGLTNFVRECVRVVRAGGTVVLSDMHPVTAVERHWKRSFQSEGAQLQLATHQWSLDSIVRAFESSGFAVVQRLEPCFEAPERRVFAAEGKLAEFTSLAAVPAIYVLVLRKPERSITSDPAADLQLDGARCAITSSTATEASIVIERGRIACVEKSDGTLQSLDLSGYLLLPGLVNAHDHLEFALFPRLGRPAGASPYCNAREWAKEIHSKHAEQIARHREITLETRLWWGAIRNLLCGVTTVCHHNPLHSELARPGFPVHVVSRFGWAHSLAFDDDLPEKHRDTASNSPFIAHAGEGVDAESADEIPLLHRMGAIDDRTVLVHALAINEHSAALINGCRASLVICPTSNQFLFHQSLAERLINSIDNVAIGSDSPLTAAGDLLDEVRYAHAETGIEEGLVYEMVTTRPAAMLRLRDGEGTIREGAVADIIAVRDDGRSPAATLAKLTFDAVELVLLAGIVYLASQPLYERLSHNMRDGMEPLEVDGHKRWVRSPVCNLLNSAEKVLGGRGLLLGGKRICHAAPL